MIIKNIIEQVEASNRPVAKIIKHNGNNKAIAIALKKGMIWPDHKASLPTILLVADGRVTYREGHETIELEKYDNFDIPVDITHSLEAQEDSLCILLQG
jgi:quercetin dioxygenase-like cupin family protein